MICTMFYRQYQIKPHLPALISALFYLSILIVWMIKIPITEAPDEQVHFEANALFIADKGRLPISGVDDLKFITNCRDNQLGAMPCTNSYNTFPALNYVISATSIRISRILASLSLVQISDVTAARLPQLFYGLIFFLSLYISALSSGLNKIISLLLSFSISLIPQVMFVFAYLNQDGFSLMSASLVILALSLSFRRSTPDTKLSRREILSIGISIGLLLSSKYNFYSLIPGISLYLGALIFRCYPNNSDRLYAALKIGSVAFAVFGPWYIRNFFLYKDILGTRFLLEKMSEFHPLGKARPFSPSGIEFLLANDWIYTNFRSFFGVFGYMSIFLRSFWYLIAALLSSVYLLGSVFLAGAGRSSRIPVLISISTAVLVIALSAYHSLTIDFQAQGRYLFPILIGAFPAATILCKESSISTAIFLIIWNLTIGAMLINSTVILVGRYGGI